MSRFDDLVRSLDSERIAWMWRSDLPVRYRKNWPDEFDSYDDFPVILNGAREIMNATSGRRRDNVHKFVRRAFLLYRVSAASYRDLMDESTVHGRSAARVRDYVNKRWNGVRAGDITFGLGRDQYWLNGVKYWHDSSHTRDNSLSELAEKHRLLVKINEELARAKIVGAA